jgi:hypothetical protein
MNLRIRALSICPRGAHRFQCAFSQQLAEVLRGVGHGEASVGKHALPLVQAFILQHTHKVGVFSVTEPPVRAFVASVIFLGTLRTTDCQGGCIRH